MTITVSTSTINFESNIDDLKSNFQYIIKNLNDHGYSPLISQAKKNFFAVFGLSEEVELDSFESIEPPIRNYPVRSRKIPLLGEIFFTENDKAILYLNLQLKNFFRRSNDEPGPVRITLEAGYIGEGNDSDYLDQFIKYIDLKGFGILPNWSSFSPEGTHFKQLGNSANTNFIRATDVTEREFELLNHLENKTERDIAYIVKRSGGILKEDLATTFTKDGLNKDNVLSTIEILMNNNLLSQKYVVICKKTSRQIFIADSEKDIQDMGSRKISCSCGKLISDEKVEVLISPTQELQKMLNKSYWMTVKLVRVLNNLGISSERILLNLKEGNEEIDAFADIDGKLLMFELKDDEFSMGHAYPFSGRIGIYKPEYAVIVAAKGISPDVNNYLDQVVPEETKAYYVDNIDLISDKIDEIVNEIRSINAMNILSNFDIMSRVSPSKLIASKIGIHSIDEYLDTSDNVFISNMDLY